MTAPTDRDLIIRARRGAAGGDAFGELVTRYQTGVFKRNDYNLMFDGGEDAYNGSFVGYVPDNGEGIPEDLDLMLDWDRILLRE